MNTSICRGTGGAHETSFLIAHTLRGDGFDASQDGTGRGTPLVPVTLYQDSQFGIAEYDTAGTLRSGREPYHQMVIEPYTLAIRGRDGGHDLEYSQDGTANALLTPNGGRGGIGVGAMAFDTAQVTSRANKSRAEPGLPCSTLSANSQMHVAFANAVAFSCKDHGADAGDVAPTLRAMGCADSHANGGGQVAVAGQSAVRRLTPRECERLQGFPDDYTAITYRGKPAADGPRYRALGNSMAVPCMAWIGQRIADVDASL